MISAKLLLLANLVVALFMTGVIWYVQIAHYPLFANVGKTAFAEYHAAHNAATTVVVALPMVIELGLAFLLLLYKPNNISFGLVALAFGLNMLIWAATFFVSVPLHGALGANGYDPATIAQLVNTNWVRTAAWTARSVLLGYSMAQVLG